MKVLIVGSGGREHAIAKALLAGPSVQSVVCAPGNPGMKRDGIEVAAVPLDDHAGLIDLCQQEDVNFAVVGPESALMNGVVDDLREAGIPALGPDRAAALIVGSKEFAKQIMDRAGVPTAAYRSFTDLNEALDYVGEVGAPIVVKADGLASGKGVVVAQTQPEAEDAVRRMLGDHEFGDACASVVIEEFLDGEEFSLMALVAGEDVYPMAIAQDHKRALDGDLGPNTGGMGAYSPVPQIGDDVAEQAVEEILIPTAAEMVRCGRPFTGVLYAGLILTEDGPKVIEFNARFGDPEAQVVLPRLKGDLGQVFVDLLEGRAPTMDWDDEIACVGVVAAADGYPGQPTVGHPIPEFALPAEAHIYYSGVANGAANPGSADVSDPAAEQDFADRTDAEDGLVSAGGRVYLVSATGKDLAAAREVAYGVLENSDTSGLFYRRDIGHRAFD